MWEAITVALASLGPRGLALQQGSGEGARMEAMGAEELVEYEGMLVAASAAQRRR